MTTLSVSIVVNTYNRADSLALTLQSLEWLDYPLFEVVVVNGPSTDATDALLQSYRGRIKVVTCNDRNLSESRNLGIRAASGDIVAFIDDDAYPDPGWLDKLVASYEWAEVAAAGGPVFSWTGHSLQAAHSRANRFGTAWPEFPPCINPTLLLAFPNSMEFTYTIGTNSSFRRTRLVEIGGFDEEFEYYLDEADVCCRLNDAGWVVAALDEGFVYHKFLPNDIRDRRDATRDWYQVMKSRFYFAMKHGYPASSFADVCAESNEFVKTIRAEVTSHIETGVLEPEVLTKFEDDVRAASNVALERFVAGAGVKQKPPQWFDEDEEPLLPFVTRLSAEEKLHICFLTKEFPPKSLNGIGRVIHALSKGLADRGHVVRVLTVGEEFDRVDLEDGVWVHRLIDYPHSVPDDLNVPSYIWNHSASLLTELVRIDAIRPIDIVQTPNWDSEGLAAIRSEQFRTVVGMYTPVKTVMDTDPAMVERIPDGAALHRQLAVLEHYTYEHVDAFLACGPAIVEEVETRYGLTLDRERLGLVPHGLSDMSVGVEAPLPTTSIRILCVGRLEGRKGIDLLLATVPKLVERGLDFTLHFVGDDSLVAASGLTYREAFEKEWPGLVSRVKFLGGTDDAELRRQYAEADIVAVPSRFESFGLTLLEAMMFSKPVVCSDIGGMREIVVDGETGFLVMPESVDELATALARLISDPELRGAMGNKGRRLYEEQFTIATMAAGAEAFYRSVTNRVPR